VGHPPVLISIHAGFSDPKYPQQLSVQATTTTKLASFAIPL
jgi:hypothetical protein